MVRKLGPVSNKKQDEYITNASFKCKKILLYIQKNSYSSQRLNAKTGNVRSSTVHESRISRFQTVAQIMGL